MPRKNKRQPEAIYESAELISIKKLGDRDGWLCHWCGCHVSLINATRDHVIPLAAGGPNNLSNIKLAHEWCNSLKGDYVQMAV